MSSWIFWDLWCLMWGDAPSQPQALREWEGQEEIPGAPLRGGR